MKYSPQIVFADVTDDGSPEDAIDQLFSQLLQIEPPPTLVNDILASIARLPLPQEMQFIDLDNVERLIIRHAQQPS